MSRTLPGSHELARHEAYHCASLLISGWPPLFCRIDMPSATLGGVVRPDWDARDPNDRETLHALLLAILMGPIADGANLDEWPIPDDGWTDADGSAGDAKQAQFLVDQLGMDQVDYLRICHRATTLAGNPRYRRLVVKLIAKLEDLELLLKPEFERIALETQD